MQSLVLVRLWFLGYEHCDFRDNETLLSCQQMKFEEQSKKQKRKQTNRNCSSIQ